jgi:hypothetical protein
MSNRKRLLAAWLCLVWVSCLGCNTGTVRPNWGNPGKIEEQRYRAVRFDPYPEADIGPDTDSRPRDYGNALPEPARARWTLR